MHWRWLAGWAALSLGVGAKSCTFSGQASKTSGESEDLSPLFERGPVRLMLSQDTPPSVTRADILVDLCAELPHNSSRSQEEECPSGTFVCKTVTNVRHGDERITQVIAAATRAESLKRDPYPLQIPKRRQGALRYSLNLTGNMYNNKQQMTKLNLYCGPGDAAPRLTLAPQAEWDAPLLELDLYAKGLCKAHKAPMRSFFGSLGHILSFVFWLALAVLAMYLLAGVWSNYQYYGARGWDLLPNRDFWREMPYMLHDAYRHVLRGTQPASGMRAEYEPV